MPPRAAFSALDGIFVGGVIAPSGVLGKAISGFSSDSNLNEVDICILLLIVGLPGKWWAIAYLRLYSRIVAMTSSVSG
jgi:hypothetical protein